MRLSLLASLALAGLLPAAVSAQSPDQGLALDHFRDTLTTIRSLAEVQALKRPARGVFALTREGLRQLREGELGTAREPYDAALMTLDGALQDQDAWPYPWFALGLVRLSMWNQKFPAKPTPRQHAGQTYRAAALDAYSQAISRDSSFGPAAQAIATLVVGMGNRELPKELIVPLRRSATNPGVSPDVHLAISRLHFGARRYREALAALDSYAARGGDPGAAALEQSRALAALEQWPEAVDRYLAGLRQMGSLGRAEYRGDLAWIAREWEMEQFDSLPDTQAGPWIARFFAQREAMELRAPNDRLKEHLRRWVYAHQNYLILRAGDMPNQAEGIGQACGNPLLKSFCEYVDPFDWDGTRVEIIIALSDIIPRFATYKRTQWEIDDRGVLYLRHGEPAERVRSVSGPPNETWKYDMPNGPLLFHFLGSKALGTIAATTLVASLPADPEMMLSRSGLDSRYAEIGFRIGRAIVNARNEMELRGRARDLLQPEIVRNQKAIAVGVATDGFPLTFKRSLEGIIQMYGVGLEAGQPRRVIAVFAVPGRMLTPQTRTDGGRGLLYPVALRLMAMDRERGVIRQLDTTRVFLSQDTLRKDQFLTGIVELPVPAGMFEVRALMTSPGTDAGASAARDSVRIPGAPGELTLSDLILGRPGGMSWSYGGRKVALNPLNAYPRGSSGELFYELAGLKAGTAYETSIAVRGASDKPTARAVIELTSTFTADGAYEQVTQGIGLEQLKPGAYRLTVTIAERGSGRSTTRWQALNVLAK